MKNWIAKGVASEVNDCTQEVQEVNIGRGTDKNLDFEMSFWWLQFSQKLNENNSTWGTIVVKSNIFVCFWENWRYQKDILKLIDLFQGQTKKKENFVANSSYVYGGK